MTRKVRNPMFPGPKAFYKRSVMESHKPVEAIARCEDCRGSGLVARLGHHAQCPRCEGLGYFKHTEPDPRGVPFAPALDAWDAEATRSLK